MTVDYDEVVYRKALHRHHMEDAEQHVVEYLEEEDVDVDANIELFDMEALAESFEENHVTSIADDLQWHNAIVEYVRSNKISFQK